MAATDPTQSSAAVNPNYSTADPTAATNTAAGGAGAAGANPSSIQPTTSMGSNTATNPSPSGATIYNTANPFAPTSPAGNASAPSSGILSSNMQQVNAPTTNNNVAQTSASTQNVTPNQTVAGQLSNVLASNSPLLQQAQANAMQTANGRGLLNSSMAAGAGTAALIQNALQIAQPDANINANAASLNSQLQTQANTTNANAQNAANQNTAQMNLQAQTTNANNAQQSAMDQYDTAFKAAMQNASAADQIQLTQVDGQVKTNLANIQAQYQTIMQTSQSAANMYSSTIQQIGAVMNNQNLDAGSKQNLITQLMSNMSNTLNLQASIANIPDVTSLIGNLAGGSASAAPASASAPVSQGGASDMGGGGS